MKAMDLDVHQNAEIDKDSSSQEDYRLASYITIPQIHPWISYITIPQIHPWISEACYRC